MRKEVRILCKWRLDSLGFCAREEFIPPFFVQAVGVVGCKVMLFARKDGK